jgi:hypothetical protein
MLVMLEKALEDPANRSKSVQSIIKNQQRGQVESIEARARIFKQKRTI